MQATSTIVKLPLFLKLKKIYIAYLKRQIFPHSRTKIVNERIGWVQLFVDPSKISSKVSPRTYILFLADLRTKSVSA